MLNISAADICEKPPQTPKKQLKTLFDMLSLTGTRLDELTAPDPNEHPSLDERVYQRFSTSNNLGNHHGHMRVLSGTGCCRAREDRRRN